MKQQKDEILAKEKEIVKLRHLMKQSEKSQAESEAAKEASLKAMMKKIDSLGEELKEKDRQ